MAVLDSLTRNRYRLVIETMGPTMFTQKDPMWLMLGCLRSYEWLSVELYEFFVCFAPRLLTDDDLVIVSYRNPSVVESPVVEPAKC
jgi:hypothetical protein